MIWNDHIKDVCLRANRRLRVMYGLKYKLCRNTLKKIYISYICPLIEYGDVIYDNCTQIAAQ